MTGILLTIVVILLVVAALEVTHRRSARRWQPGRDERADRDAARLAEELRVVAQAEPRPFTRADLVHLAAPASASTDARLLTRTAA
jgi:hypothetical protein